ncbi:MAG: glycosyltransferase family 4 protein [Bacteroidales bacterium]|nr:glycosyltransferase family 4 protein [Bacteroidales bacterium]
MMNGIGKPHHTLLQAVTRRMRQPLRMMARRFRDAWRGETDQTYYDVHDIKQWNALLTSCGISPLTCDAQQAEIDPIGAARYLISLLVHHRYLHVQFPNALTAGNEGAFARWLAQNGAAKYGLTPSALQQIQACFSADYAGRARRIYAIRDDLRQAWPLALTPKQRGIYLKWLLTQGAIDFQLQDHEVFWYMMELAEDPSYGLITSYRVQPSWQAAVPHGLTRFGWEELRQWIARQYQFQCRWLRSAQFVASISPYDELQAYHRAHPDALSALPDSTTDVRTWIHQHPHIQSSVDPEWIATLQDEFQGRVAANPSVNVIGLFRYTSGLQQAAHSTVTALNRMGIRTALRDYPDTFLRERVRPGEYDSIEQYDITILNTGIDLSIPSVYHHCGLYPRPDVYRIATWWWELESLPADWYDRAEGVDEIWAPTEFITQAMRTAFRKPVTTMPPGVALPPFTKREKSDFGLDSQKMTYLFIFDMNSRIQRKNPLGVIQAFRQAFRPDEPVELVIKVSQQEQFYSDHWRTLRSAVRDAGVHIIDRMLSRADLFALLDCVDCYVSLHRSEGFGLTCAEAMLLGKPVIATGYSGNLDFMNSQNSLLVSYDRQVLQEDIPPYPRGAYWAEPHTGQAADMMRWVYTHPEAAAQMAARGQDEASRRLAPETAGQRMLARLRQIQSLRG